MNTTDASSSVIEHLKNELERRELSLDVANYYRKVIYDYENPKRPNVRFRNHIIDGNQIEIGSSEFIGCGSIPELIGEYELRKLNLMTSDLFSKFSKTNFINRFPAIVLTFAEDIIESAYLFKGNNNIEKLLLNSPRAYDGRFYLYGTKK